MQRKIITPIYVPLLTSNPKSAIIVFMRNLIATLGLTIAMLVANVWNACAGNLWDQLKAGNHFALIRHALAPGYSDPEQFNVEDCNTQRNLNEEGRNQSKKIGDLFRSNSIKRALVYSSQWCRCLDTARLLDLGDVTKLPALNSFFENFERETLQTMELKRWIETISFRTPTVLVSHQVNITALLGYTPESGEIIFVKRSSNKPLTITGTIPTLH